ncbi:MAG: mycofactocin biosynthesis glycosyltransferase MftF [Actinomycetota bacterium]|nr:mycofactocin biosynthesis glycosyltransferase MftF [Actinomycetota bacterium]
MTRRPPLPATFGLRLDAAVRRTDGGRALVGGSPLRILRLRPAGVDALTRWERGEPVGTGSGARLARRLVDADIAHPVPVAASAPPADVTVVIPVRDDPGGVATTVAAVRRDAPGLAVVVVDDGSDPPVGQRLPRDVTVIRRAGSGGPGPARNDGLATVSTDLVLFVDAGVEPSAGWFDSLVAHLADEAVVAVAPRIRSVPGPSVRERYETANSPLDLGPAPARVQPRARVSYVPTACLLARTAAVRAAGAFDSGLRYGEDVDLVWRLVAAGGTVRYEPGAEATHPPRGSWPAWARQRVGYGSAAAPLATRHPGAVPPAAVSAWSAAAWLLVATGRPMRGVGVAAASTAMLPRRLSGMDDPEREAVRLAGWGHVLAGRVLAAGITRAWWPVVAALAVRSRRARLVLAAAAVVPPLLEWRSQRPPLDPVRYAALRVADDVSYSVGLWRGSLAQRSIAALLPDLSNWPGRRRAVERIGPRRRP